MGEDSSGTDPFLKEVPVDNDTIFKSTCTETWLALYIWKFHITGFNKSRVENIF
jgi:hypothetical protein